MTETLGHRWCHDPTVSPFEDTARDTGQDCTSVLINLTVLLQTPGHDQFLVLNRVLTMTLTMIFGSDRESGLIKTQFGQGQNHDLNQISAPLRRLLIIKVNSPCVVS